MSTVAIPVGGCFVLRGINCPDFYDGVWCLKDATIEMGAFSNKVELTLQRVIFESVEEERQRWLEMALPLEKEK